MPLNTTSKNLHMRKIRTKCCTFEKKAVTLRILSQTNPEINKNIEIK